MEGRQLNPLIDPVFKRIFGEEKEIIIEIINAVIQLEHPVVNIEYLPPELLPATIDDKTTIVDVRDNDVLNGHFFVEMQVAYQADLLKRILFNASRVYGRQLERGGNYDKLLGVGSFETGIFGCTIGFMADIMFIGFLIFRRGGEDVYG